MSENTLPLASEYEVFVNKQNALAFFMHRHPSLDGAEDAGPFWFAIHNDDTLVAGTEENYAIFPNVSKEVIDIAKQRKIVMIVEFENQKAIRCTPCYLSSVSA